MTDLNDVIEKARSLYRDMSYDSNINALKYSEQLDPIIRDLEALRNEKETTPIPDTLREMGKRIVADNRSNDHFTAHPLFVVQRRKDITGLDLDYVDSVAWIDLDSGGERVTDPDEIADLQAQFLGTGMEPDGYVRTGYEEYWEDVETYLTPQAAEARIGGHPGYRVFVESAHRNHELRTVREFLASLAAPQSDTAGWPEDQAEPHIGVPGPGYDPDHRD